MIEPGVVLGGKYRVDEVLGRGGMGVVVAATHVQLGTQVALKFLRDGLIDNHQIMERFMREARAAAKLKGEHVCRVFDVTMIDNMPCLVMEKLDGIDLAKLLRRDGPMPVQVVADYLLQTCAGMAEAHTLRIIHRDLKPANLFLTSRTDGAPLIKIFDFGIAKAFDGAEHELTHSNVILGSPSYMSPEQIKASRLADARSDIWSIGVILFELVAGKKPFTGEGIANLALNIATEPTPPLPRGPAALNAVIARCLDKEPARRYQNVAELAAALAPFASDANRSLVSSVERVFGRASGAAPLLAASDAEAPVPSQYEVSDQQSTIRAASGVVVQPASAPARSRGWIVLAFALLMAASSAIVIISMQDPEPPQPASRPSNTPAAAGPVPAAAPPAVVAPVAADAAIEPPPGEQPAVTESTVDAGAPVDTPKRAPKPTSKRRQMTESRI